MAKNRENIISRVNILAKSPHFFPSRNFGKTLFLPCFWHRFRRGGRRLATKYTYYHQNSQEMARSAEILGFLGPRWLKNGWKLSKIAKMQYIWYIFCLGKGLFLPCFWKSLFIPPPPGGADPAGIFTIDPPCWTLGGGSYVISSVCPSVCPKSSHTSCHWIFFDFFCIKLARYKRFKVTKPDFRKKCLGPYLGPN